jgi:hypothetical protein
MADANLIGGVTVVLADALLLRSLPAGQALAGYMKI